MDDDPLESTSVQKSEKQKEHYLAHVFKQLISTLDKNNAILESLTEKLGSMGSPAKKSQSNVSAGSASKNLPDIKKSEKAKVELKVTFMKITDIDTVDQTFEAEIFIQAKWVEPALDNLTGVDFDEDVMWDPKLLIMNLDGEFSFSRVRYNIIHNMYGYNHAVVIKLWRFRGFFKESLELEHFPMDVQDLTISVSTERAVDEVELTEDHISLSSVNTKTFLDAQEWKIYDHVETYRDQTTVEHASSTEHPILHAQCRVARKVGYFVWNIIFIVCSYVGFGLTCPYGYHYYGGHLETLVIFLISGLTFATFAIEPNSADRLAVTITLFLTAVAFKFVVKQSLPTISYLTYLDLYVLSSLMFLGLHATQNACLKSLAEHLDSKALNSYDNYSILSLGIVFVMFHIIFGIYIFFTASKRRRIMEEKDKFYLEKRKYLEKYGVIKTYPRGNLKV